MSKVNTHKHVSTYPTRTLSKPHCTMCVAVMKLLQTLMAAVLTTMSLLWAMAMREKCWTTSPTTMWARESGMSMSTFLTWPRRPTSRLVWMSSLSGPSVSSDPPSWPARERENLSTYRMEKTGYAITRLLIESLKPTEW